MGGVGWGGRIRSLVFAVQPYRNTDLPTLDNYTRCWRGHTFTEPSQGRAHPAVEPQTIPVKITKLATGSHGTYVMLGEFNLDGFRVSSDGLLFTQQALGVRQPRKELVQGVLKLTQRQESALQLVLPRSREETAA